LANPVIGPTGEPTVIKDGDIWRMWYLDGGSINYLTGKSPLDLRETVAYQVSANLNNVNSADVTLNFPKDLLSIAEITPGNALQATIDTSVDGAIHFVGVKYSGPVPAGNVVLFNVTFHTDAQGSGALSFGKAEFGMPAVGSSSNVYLAAKDETTGSATVQDLPFLKTNLNDSYFLVGEARAFNAAITTYTTAYPGATLTLTPTAGFSITGSLTGGLPAGQTTTVSLSGTASTPGSKTVAFDVYDGTRLLFSTVETVEAYDKPTITVSTTDQYLIVNEAGAFNVTITNPTTGRNYANTVVFDLNIQGPVGGSISSLVCTGLGHTWTYTNLTADGTGLITARITGEDGYFTVPANGIAIPITCNMTVTKEGDYTASANMVDVITVTPLVERVVSSVTPVTLTAYLKPVITTTNLAGPFDAGVAETVTLSIANASIPEPFNLLFNYPAGTVIVYGLNTYTCTDTGCPLIPVVLTGEPAELNFSVTFDEAWTGTVGVSLYDSDWVSSPRLLASTTTTATVNGNFTVTGTFSMQGRSSRAGIPVTFTWGGTLVPYGPSASTSNVISNNLTITLTYGGSYTITTNQPRYLNVITGNNKLVAVDGN
jgi:hypothetical protein